MAAKQTLSPRQRMINLMYLVFIAMLALNMDKEVLRAFGLGTEKLQASISMADERNNAAYEGLTTKAGENAEKFGELNENAQKIKQLSAEFQATLDEVQSKINPAIAAGKVAKDDYQVQDRADDLDQYLFKGEGYTPAGQAFVDAIEKYRDGVTALVGKDFPEVANAVKERFNTGDENGKSQNRDGKKVDWLAYNFKGFPSVASTNRVVQMKSDVKTSEEEILNAMLGGKLKEEISMKNYSTLLQTPKSAYYSGEVFDGNIVLGRTDNSTKPNKVELTLDGRKLEEGTDFTMEGGQVKLKVAAGRPGDHTIEGKLIFSQDGEDIEVPVTQTFATITKPNAAVISADKMNVVYRGVDNPITVSIPGIPDNKVSASAPGLKRVSGSKYVMRPQKGREVNIRASGKLPDGRPVGSSVKFRIKDIPRPVATVRGEAGSTKMSRNNLSIASIGAVLEDFDFDIRLAVSSFKFKVPGQPTIKVNGRKLDARAKSALRRAKRGDIVQVFDLTTSIVGSSTRPKKVSPVTIEITN